MPEKIIIKKENVVPVYESRFAKVYDLQYKPGKHYYDSTRRSLDDIAAIKTDDEFREMLPDAVTCIVIVEVGNDEPKLLLAREYRYPTGQFILSPPAGLIDPEDKDKPNPLIETARREILEETGIQMKDTDSLKIVNPLVFSTPGMTDESNALVLAQIKLNDLSCLDQNGAVGSELFDGFRLVNKKEARDIIEAGRDEFGNFYSGYTWMALMYFLSDLY